MTCLQKYTARVAAADAWLAAQLEACNGDTECERIAVDAHYAEIQAAWTEYNHCMNGGSGDPE